MICPMSDLQRYQWWFHWWDKKTQKMPTMPWSRYYNTERRQLKFKMARGQISELEVFRSLISCTFVKNWADHIWAPWRNENSILNFKKVARNDLKMDHICFDIICIMYFGSFERILEHFINFLKWPEKKFEVIFRSIFRPLFLYLLEIYMTSDIYDVSFHCSI
jgi:hypothetical protein